VNPVIGIAGWVVIGALAGLIGSKILRSDARQGALANIGIGILGAVLAGFLARGIFGPILGPSGLLVSFGMALAGSCLLIGRRR
jgi:uncharacterized membrane protein YeaQ/YmgE (transglycosylase-associated protein family)